MVDFNRLDALVKQQGKKKSHLCTLAGKGRGYISDAKNGNGTISDAALEIFAAELGTTVAYLTGQADEPGIKKAPSREGGRKVGDEEIKFALFGGAGDITDAMYEEVRNFAAYVKQREAEKKE